MEFSTKKKLADITMLMFIVCKFYQLDMWKYKKPTKKKKAEIILSRARKL